MAPTDDKAEFPTAGKSHSADKPLPNFTITSDEYAHNLYRHLIGDKGVGDFLDESTLYDSTTKKWSASITPTTRQALLGSVLRILSSIVRSLVRPMEPIVEREVVNIDHTVAGQKVKQDAYRIVVRAAGPSFQIPRRRKTAGDLSDERKTIGYSCMATYFTVKLESELGSDEDILEEVISYARCVDLTLAPLVSQLY